MKNFLNLRGRITKFKMPEFKIPKIFKPKYKQEWEEITKTNKLDQEDALKAAEDLLKNKKYIESMITLERVNPVGLFKRYKNEINEKKALISQFVKNEMILRRYSVFKKYLSLGDEYNKLVRSSFFTFLILSLSFFLYFGSLKELIEHIKRYFNGNESIDYEEPKKSPNRKWTSAPFNFNNLYTQKNFKFAKNLSERLKDVKGIDEVRGEIEEVVKMLKNPEKYENAGAKLVRGILLIGKPGTGKTLLARALAGESGVNFIYISASEFDKSLVGMGNKLLKNLFTQARENKPCIIFIDEIDTLLHSGRRQGKYSSSFDRSLINTFLAEMDGFKAREHIFVMGATNSEKDLDKAALRPGRFDKIIHVPIPDKHGRRDIFDLYLKKIKMPLNADISSDILSRMTPGFTGAEIENMVNTAIISAVDFDKQFISKQDFEDARDRVVLGIKRRIKNSTVNVRSLLQTAIHEAGHTLVCYNDKICNKGIHKVTIIPRGESKGKTSTLLDEMEGTREEFLSMIDMSLAGLIAEELYFGEKKVGVGCGSDLSRATSLAKRMVKQYAMDKKFGYMVVDDDYIVSHRISGDTRNELDVAVANILKQRSSSVKEKLKENISDLKTLAQKLVEYEELNKSDIEKILSGQEVDSSSNDKREKKRTVAIEGIAL